MIAVVEQADIPAPAQMGEEVQQGAGPFGKLEAVQHFVVQVLRAAADHIPDVQLGGVVIGQVDDRIAALVQCFQDGRSFGPAAVQAHAHKYLRLGPVSVAVVELGH